MKLTPEFRELTIEAIERMVAIARKHAGIEAAMKAALQAGDDQRALALARELVGVEPKAKPAPDRSVAAHEAPQLAVPKPATPRRAYSVSDLAAMYPPKKSFWWKEIRSGRLGVRRFGRRVVVMQEDLDVYIESQRPNEEKQ